MAFLSAHLFWKHRGNRTAQIGAVFALCMAAYLKAGTVEQNAGIIAGFIKTESPAGKKIILVSTSKGRPETGYAFGHLIGGADACKILALVAAVTR